MRAACHEAALVVFLGEPVFEMSSPVFLREGGEVAPEGVTDAQVLGSAVHSALATYHIVKLQSGEAVTAESIRQAYLDAWDGQVEDGQVVTLGGKSLGDSRDLGMTLVEVYLEQPPPGPSSRSRAR